MVEEFKNFIKKKRMQLISITSAIFIFILYIYLGSLRPLTVIENILFQIICLAFSIYASFLFGQQSSKDNAQQIIKPHARSAFRRLISLYKSLSRTITLIDEQAVNKQIENTNQSEITIKILRATIIEQLTTADDALEDWRDIVPEDVEELINKLHKKEGSLNE